jgi:hypothetical protein
VRVFFVPLVDILTTLSCAVSQATPASALSTVDVKIFRSVPVRLGWANIDIAPSNRHEFIHIFRYLECKTFHPADVHILEIIDDRHKTYEEESDTVFLAKDVTERMSKLSSRAAMAPPQQFSRMRRR